MDQYEITSFNFVKGDFEFELGALHIHMMEEIKVIFTPFLEFASIYNVIKAHNMFAFMLNLWFKILRCFKNICWKGQTYTYGGRI